MTDFLMPMLSWQPAMRRSATEAMDGLSHAWCFCGHFPEALKHPWVQPREGEVDAGHPFDVSDVACRSHQEPVAKEAPAQTPEAPEEAPPVCRVVVL